MTILFDVLPALLAAGSAVGGAASTVAPILGAVGTGVSALAAGSAASYQAEVAHNNAIAQRQMADYEKAAGQVKATASGLANAGAGGALKTKIAGAGVDVNSGSAVDVQAGQHAAGLLDTEQVLNNADLKSYGYTVAASNSDAQAKLYENQAEAAPITGSLNAFGSLAGNAKSWGGASGGTGGYKSNDPMMLQGGVGW